MSEQHRQFLFFQGKLPFFEFLGDKNEIWLVLGYFQKKNDYHINRNQQINNIFLFFREFKLFRGNYKFRKDLGYKTKKISVYRSFQKEKTQIHFIGVQLH